MNSDHHHHHNDSLWGRIRDAVAGHDHDSAAMVSNVIDTSGEGLRAVWISLAGLAATGIFQAVVYVFTGSVALLGDTFHNVSDALTALPLAVAFVVGRRAADKRYTYGYGRWEDVAGLFIVAAILVSAAFTGYESFKRLLDPQELTNIAAVAVASLVGFFGNELVARYRIRVGRRIGSAALVADGLHARTDGFTSLAVMVAAGGAALGLEWADPVVGLLICVAILAVARRAAIDVGRRLVDAVDPDITERVEATCLATEGVAAVSDIRIRWVGHELHASCTVQVAQHLSIAAAHEITENVEHDLLHALPRLTAVSVHACPVGNEHTILKRHRDLEC